MKEEEINKYLPVIGVTMGDPSGIGPEIALKVFSMAWLYHQCRPILIGNISIMRSTARRTGIPMDFNRVEKVSDSLFTFGTMDVLQLPFENESLIEYGKISAASGDIAFRAVKKAIELAMSGEVDANVTNPLHKGALNAAGHNFSGHTEIYAHYTGSPKVAMLLADEKFRVIHVSTHVSLRKACDMVKKERVLETIRLLDETLKRLGLKDPRIGVAGLNPHAGDGGLFGDEEIIEIIPAIGQAREEGINAEGPFPPDTLFSIARGGRFDGCVAMYHDQGHIPFKLSGFEWDNDSQTMKSVRGVNITLGLPIIRTSVDHGTAFEIAGKGIASPDALVFAVEYAVKLFRSRNKKNQ